MEDRAKQLAHALRLQRSEWRRMCYVPVRGRIERRTFLGQIVGAHQLNYTRPRICPCCIRSSSIWWAVWDLKLVSACPIHRCLLVDQCPSCGDKLTWHRRAVHQCRCGMDLRGFEPQKADDNLVAINAAIWRAAGFRQEGLATEVRRVDFLPDQIDLRLDSLLRLIRFLGSVQENGRLRRKQIRPFADLDIATRIGIAATTLLMEWPQSFKATLHRMADEQSAGAGVLNFHKVFGNFYRHLFNVLPRDEFGFLHDAFESFVAEGWNGLVRGQHRWFSKALRQNTKWITASEAQKIYGIRNTTIRDLAHQREIEGMFVESRRRRKECWIRRKSLGDWIAERKAKRATYMPGSEVRHFLGVKHETLLKIAEAGLIRYSKGVDKSFPKGFCFLREDVLRIKQAFDKSLVETRTYSSPGAVIALRHALKNYLGRDAGLPAVIGAIIDGSLAPVGITNRFPGILDYLFRSEDLRSYRPTQAPMPPGGFLNYKEAARLLETRTEVIRGLVIHGILRSPNEYRFGLAKLVSAMDVQRFAAMYVDASCLAKSSGYTNHQLRRFLSEIKIPTLDVLIPMKGRKTFVKREALQHFQSPVCKFRGQNGSISTREMGLSAQGHVHEYSIEGD